MSTMSFPEPDYMADEEIRMFHDAVGKFLDQRVDDRRIAKWREDGQVEREFWREAGAADFTLDVMLAKLTPEQRAAADKAAQAWRDEGLSQ